jgi:hypothetical protein
MSQQPAFPRGSHPADRSADRRLACPEDLIHDLGADCDQRPQCTAVHDLGGLCEGMPGQLGDLIDADPRWLIRLTNEVRSSRGGQLSPMPAALHAR